MREALIGIKLVYLLSDCSGIKILSYYEQFFNIEYPLPKQDMIAIPDFASVLTQIFISSSSSIHYLL